MAEKKEQQIKRITNLLVDRIAICPAPANPGAYISLFKSKDRDIEKMTFDEAIRERVIDEAISGWLDKIWAANSALRQSISETLEDGNITNKKEVIQQNINQYVLAVQGYLTSMPVVPAITKEGENNMTPEEIAKQKEELRKQIEVEILKRFEDRLNLAEARANMTDDQKAYFDGLKKEDEKAAFLKMDSKQRQAVVSVVKAADETIEANGIIVRKSEVSSGVFELLKAQQAAIISTQESARLEKELREEQEYIQKAEREYPSLPGAPILKGRILRAVEKMESTEKEGLLAILKGAEKVNHDYLFKEHGARISLDDSDPESRLESMAKEEMKKSSIPFDKAYERVIKSDEGKRLYAEIAG